MKTAIIQFAPELANVNATIIRLEPLIKAASDAELLVLPELANSGYNFSNKEMAFAASEPIDEKSGFLSFLLNYCQKNNQLIVTGFNERTKKGIYNSAVLLGPNGILGKYRKLHLFMNEKNFFLPGDVGLPVFDIAHGRLGMLVCFDWMFPEAWRTLALKGAQIICHPSNLVLPYAQKAVTTHAINNRIFVVTANRVGAEQNLTFTGRSVMVAPNSEYIAQASHDGEEALTGNIDLTLADNKNITPLNHAFNDRRIDVYGDLSK